MTRILPISECVLEPSSCVFFLTEARDFDGLGNAFDLRGILVLAEVGFCGAFGAELHDMADDLIIQANIEGPMTQLFADLAQLAEYVCECDEQGIPWAVFYDEVSANHVPAFIELLISRRE